MSLTLQKANSVLIKDGVTKDDLLLQYGAIQGTIAGSFVYRDLVNTNYIDEPVKGGTIKVRRLKTSSSQEYGTARTAGSGNGLQNNFEVVTIDTDREFSEEMNAKDKKLYAEGGALGLLTERGNDYAISMGVELENAYFTLLEELAIANTLIDVSSGANLQEQLGILIRALEGTENDNVKKVDRRLMVMTLKSELYDELEGIITTFSNPITGRTDARAFRSVEVRRAVRQTDNVDAIVQVAGSIAQPVVMDDFYVAKPDFSNDAFTYMSYYYGEAGIMPELILGCNIDGAVPSA